MFFTIYKITNLSNQKIYIGKHQTTCIDDGYMGSGKLLKRAIQKYGLDQFAKEILYIFDTEEEMNIAEVTLVSDDFCSRPDTYNICRGGQGGFSYINSIKTPEERTKAGLAGGLANPTEYIKANNAKWGAMGYAKGIGQWIKTHDVQWQFGMLVMQSEKANEKRKATMKGSVSVYDLVESRVVRFTTETRHIYDSDRGRFMGLRAAKKRGLL